MRLGKTVQIGLWSYVGVGLGGSGGEQRLSARGGEKLLTWQGGGQIFLSGGDSQKKREGFGVGCQTRG